jgi:hypothetical protein
MLTGGAIATAVKTYSFMTNREPARWSASLRFIFQRPQPYEEQFADFGLEKHQGVLGCRRGWKL